MNAGKNATLANELFKTHDAVDLGEQGVIPAHTHIFAGVHAGTQLAYQNVAGQNGLTAEALDAASLARAVAAVARRTACFLMSHDILLARAVSGTTPNAAPGKLAVDAFDADGRIVLTMAAQLARVITPPALEDHHLGSAAVLHHFGGHGGPGDVGSADLAVGATDHQNLIQLHFAAGSSRELFHNNFGTFFDAVLFAARFDNRVHGVTSEKREVYLPQTRKNVKCHMKVFRD